MSDGGQQKSSLQFSPSPLTQDEIEMSSEEMLQLTLNVWMSSLQRNQGKLLISIAVVNEGILCSSFFLQTVKEGEY